ncbi:hypothetical protein [Streptomyces sp. NPDC053367]
MSEQTDQDRAPRTNQILAEPATVAACQRDYAQAADVREVMDAQDRGDRH